MRRTRLASWIVFAGVLLLMSGAGLSTAIIRSWEEANGTQKLDRLTVRVNPESASAASADPTGSAGWTLRQMERIAAAWAPLPSSWSASRSDTIAYGQVSVTGDVIGVSEDDGLFTQRWIRSGSPVTETALTGHSRVAVLGTEMAEMLFRSTDVTGKSVEIGGTAFHIVGVFEESSSLLRSMTNDSRPDIIVPVTTLLDLYPGLSIQEMRIAADSGSWIADEDRIRQLLAAAGSRSDSFVIDSDVQEHRWIAQKTQLLLFAAGVGAMAAAARVLILQLSQAYRRIQASLAKDDWMDVLRSNRLWLLGRTLIVLALAAGIGMMWLLIRYPLYLPAEMIPDRWIDLSFFRDLVGQRFLAVANQAGAASHDGQTLMRQRVNELVSGLAAAGLLAGLPFTWIGIKLWRSAGLGSGSMAVRIFLYILAAHLVMLAAARQANIDIIISPHDPIILWGWLLSVTGHHQIITNKKEW
ncbi:ABC transporter permease [Paenibacillus sepulcri]